MKTKFWSIFILILFVLFTFSSHLYSKKDTKKNTKKTVKKKPDPVLSFSNFLFNRLYIDARAGLDYYYIDPGNLIPKDNSVSIESNPYLYYYINAGLDLNFIGIECKLKNGFEWNNYSNDYLNTDHTVIKEKEAKTKERIFNMIGYFTPFQYKNKFNFGIYLDGEYRQFQAGIKVNDPVDFIDKSETIPLTPDEKHIINIFCESYAGGLMLSKTKPYIYKAAVGYKYNQVNAPHYIKSSNTIETITSVRHSLFVYTDIEYSSKRFTTESNYGLAKFKRPNDDIIKFYETEQFYYANVKNTYGFTFAKFITLSGYLGYSGYYPLVSQSAPSITIAVLTELYFYQKAIRASLVPMFQSFIQLANYFLLRSFGNVYYGEIVVGAQVGFKFSI